jgi:SAM-dependent methyltransferase
VLGLREVNEEDFFPIDYGNMHKSGACLGCLLGDPCRGTFAAAFARFGEGWLRPVPGGRPNSFNYFPAGDAATGHEPGPREIVVAEGERGTLVATDTGDFSDQEILRTRDETQQVYQQVDDQPFLTDFGRQLRKLLPAGRPGWRTPADRDCFLPAEEAVGRVLERLSGRVLDVGCGQPRYAALLERKLAAGEIAYVGVDPHLPADAKLQPGGGALLALPCAEELARVRPGELRWVRAGIEGLAVPPGAFDWVLVLRSYNHLLDLWSAGRGILRALRWGGCLLVVDNVPFGVVRSRVDRGTIKAIPRGAGMEHLRTHGAAEAEAFLARFPLRVEQRSEVGPDTSNQWVLLYRKLWPAGLPGRDAY